MSDETATSNDGVECWCCGEARDEAELVRLGCHPEVALCEVCVGWLGQRQARQGSRTVHGAVPVLATGDLARALDHYRALGFEADAWEGGGYGFLQRDGVELHVGAVDDLDPARRTVSVYLHVADADSLHAEWLAASVGGALVAPSDTDYGLREGHHVDPDGNLVRFGSPIADGAPASGVLLAGDDPLALAATAAVQAGDLDQLRQLLGDNPQLATARIGDTTMSRTLLHAATDWPGHYPDVARVIALLVDAGADVDARFHGPHEETPLHWAASSNDVAALDALLDAGADIDAPGAVLGGGSPLADASGFGQWKAARRLVERGATTRLGDAAALGLVEQVQAALGDEPPPTPDDITGAFWSACHGGQRSTAELLLSRGADVNWIGWGDLTPLDVAVQADAGDLVTWLRSRGAKSKTDLTR